MDDSYYAIIMGTILFFFAWIFLAFTFKKIPLGRTLPMLCFASLYIVTQILTTSDALNAISYETLLLLLGMMIMTILLERENFFAIFIRLLSYRCTQPKYLLLRFVTCVALFSAILTNDSVCLFFTPLVIQLCETHSLHPLPFLIALMTSANIGSSFTPIGNPQNMIIANFSGISFGRFVITNIASAIVGIIVNCVALSVAFKNELSGNIGLGRRDSNADLTVEVMNHVHSETPEDDHGLETLPPASSSHSITRPKVPIESPDESSGDSSDNESHDDHERDVGMNGSINIDRDPSQPSQSATFLSGSFSTAIRRFNHSERFKLVAFSCVLFGTVVAFVAGADLGWTSMIGATIMLCIDWKEPDETFKKVDWGLLVFFSSLFIVVEGFHATGLPSDVWDAAAPVIDMNSAFGIFLFVIIIIVGSNTVSNVPLVLLMAPSIQELGDPDVAWLLLAYVSTIAGNLTIVGSVANIIVCTRSKPFYNITFMEYIKFGLPTTLLNAAIGAILIRLII